MLYFQDTVAGVVDYYCNGYYLEIKQNKPIKQSYPLIILFILCKKNQNYFQKKEENLLTLKTRQAQRLSEQTHAQTKYLQSQ